VEEVSDSISRACERRVLIALVVLAAALRLVRLGAQSLWVDEMLTLIVATPKPGYPLGQLLLHNIHGPLHTLVVAWARTVSEGEAWLRLPSALAGILSVPLLHAWVRPRFGARVALWSAGLLAVNPLHLHYSQELRNYAFAVGFVLAASVQLDRVLVRWSLARAAALAACIAGGVLSNFSACFVFLVQTVVFFVHTPARGAALRRWAGVTAMVLAFTAPWIYRVTTYVDFERLATPVRPGDIEAAERLRGDTTFRWEAVPYALYAYSVGFALGPTLAEMHGDVHDAVVRNALPVAWTALVFGGLVIVGLRRARRSGGAARALEIVLYVAVPLGATLLLNWQNAKAFNARYVLVGLPAYLAVVALGIESSGRTRRALAALAVGATCAVALGNYYADPGRQKEDVRSATLAVEARLRPGECIFAPTVWQIVAHYQRTEAPLHYVYGDPPGTMERQLEELFSSCVSLWYVRARPWVDDADGRVLSALDSRYRRAEVLEFPGVSALHFVPKN
jgi:hypothetical protein